MILTLILAAAAGWAARPVEPHVTEFLVARMSEQRLPDASDRRVAALLVTCLVAALVLVISRTDVSPILFVIGAALGYFQEEIRKALTSRQS